MSTTPAPISVYLVDDHTVVRQSVRVMLEAEADIVVVGEAGEGRAGVRGIAATLPTVAIVDLKMPGLPGLATIPEILAAAPRTGIIVFTMYDNASYVHEAMHAGASGYVLKSAADHDLVEACRAAMRGEPFLYPAAVTALIRDYLDRAGRGEAVPADPLTPREVEIVKLGAEGYSSDEIAEALVISKKTVEHHRSHVLEKLGMRDRVELTRYAIRRGLVEP